jgi:hypothetical protein
MTGAGGAASTTLTACDGVEALRPLLAVTTSV